MFRQKVPSEVRSLVEYDLRVIYGNGVFVTPPKAHNAGRVIERAEQAKLKEGRIIGERKIGNLLKSPDLL